MEEKIGRNDSCSCGSGKKYKNCCMNKPTLAERMKKHQIKAKWLNEPQGENLMERTFGNSIVSTGKKYEKPKMKDEKEN